MWTDFLPIFSLFRAKERELGHLQVRTKRIWGYGLDRAFLCIRSRYSPRYVYHTTSAIHMGSWLHHIKISRPNKVWIVLETQKLAQIHRFSVQTYLLGKCACAIIASVHTVSDYNSRQLIQSTPGVSNRVHHVLSGGYWVLQIALQEGQLKYTFLGVYLSAFF